MFEPGTNNADAERSVNRKLVLLGLAVVYLLVSLFFIARLNRRLAALEGFAGASVEELRRQVTAVDADSKASAETIASKVGSTERQLAERSAELKRRQAALQRQQEAAEQRLAEQQQQQMSQVSGQMSQVSGAVAGVRSEVVGVQSQVAATQAELQQTAARLERAIGDLGLQSGLIARTREDLEALRRRGERDYHEFTLQKSERPTRVSVVSLRLKTADVKRGRFTLDVLADDRTIEKKNRSLNEPIQFYVGPDRQLYELVVFTATKNRVTGYLSTPKTAAVAGAK